MLVGPWNISYLRDNCMCVYESSYLTGLVERLDTYRYLTDRLVCNAVSATEQNLGDFISYDNQIWSFI